MHKILVISLAALALAGCNTEPVKKAEPQQQTQNSDSGSNNNTAPMNNASQAQSLSAEQAAKQALSSVGFIIYFDYDKSDLKPEYASVIAAHAKYLTSNPSLKVRLEGNTDERGSREYNIGLGERRAQAVRRVLMLQGVSENQITTLSYGEERPAVDGHDEAAYAKNRRVEISY
ncbi:MAG: peptidoglycan-associated lipoprotein Pal [Steroidobacter sp.]